MSCIHIYTMAYTQPLKIMKPCHLQQHDGPGDGHTKWSKSKTNIIWYRLYVESKKKKGADEFIYKTETDYSHSKQTYGYKGESRERDKFGVWD